MKTLGGTSKWKTGMSSISKPSVEFEKLKRNKRMAPFYSRKQIR